MTSHHLAWLTTFNQLSFNWLFSLTFGWRLGSALSPALPSESLKSCLKESFLKAHTTHTHTSSHMCIFYKCLSLYNISCIARIIFIYNIMCLPHHHALMSLNILILCLMEGERVRSAPPRIPLSHLPAAHCRALFTVLAPYALRVSAN